MGVKGLLRWIKKKYPRVIRETTPTFENYDMLFVDIPQYVSIIFQSTAKPYSNASILMCNILSDIDKLVQFSQPNKVIFFSFESINGLLPYAKAILKRFRTITLSKKEASRLAQQLGGGGGGYVSTTEEDNIEVLDTDELQGGDDELQEAFKEFSKLGEENDNNIDNSTIIQKVKEMVEKINKSRVKKAKKEKKDKESQGAEQNEEDIELDEDEMPNLISVDEFLNTVKKADYDKELVPDINEFLIEFREEFKNFVQNKLRSDPLYQNKRVIISDSFAQGEAEHKIMDFLRNESQEPNWDPNTKICICSMDNDLINLSLQTYIRNITLVNYVNNDLSALLIDIKVLRDSIGLELNATEQQLVNRIDDIVMMTILISNDFTPVFPDFPGCSMDTLFQLYKTIIEKNPDFVLFKDGHFVLESVKLFLNTLIKEKIAPDENVAKGYLMAFEKMFPNSPIEEMSKSYFETIAWTMYLYKYGNPSYSHYYKYEYAPPLSTAIQYVDAIEKSINDFKDDFQYLSSPVQFVLSGGVKKGSVEQKLVDKLKSQESPVAYMFEKDSKKNKKKKKKAKKNKGKKKDASNTEKTNDDNNDENQVEKENDENDEDDNSNLPKKIDIELAIRTVNEYEKELNLRPKNAKVDPTLCYYSQNNIISKKDLFLNQKGEKHPFKYSSGKIKDSIFEPEFWPLMDELTFEQANTMVSKMIFYSRPYKVPATIKEVLKYDDVPVDERNNAFHQISIEDPLKKKPKKSSKSKKRKQKKNKAKNSKDENTETETETDQETTETEADKDTETENNENDELTEDKINEIKEKLIFFRVTPLSQYENKEKFVKDIIVYAPYTMIINDPAAVMSYVKRPNKSEFVITQNGYYGRIHNIDYNTQTAKVDCFIPQSEIDSQIREIVKHDSENYLTEEEFANEVGITLESVPLVASRLILMPDDSNIAIKFYSTRYNKIMCGYCIQQEDKYLFSKEAVKVAKKYLNQPKIFKQLIEQSASQLDKRVEYQLEKEMEKKKEKEKKNKKNKNKKNKKNKNKDNDNDNDKEPETKLEKVVGDEEQKTDSSDSDSTTSNDEAEKNNNNIDEEALLEDDNDTDTDNNTDNDNVNDNTDNENENHQKETKPNKQQRGGDKPNKGRGGSKEQQKEEKHQNQERGGKQNRGGRGGGRGGRGRGGNNERDQHQQNQNQQQQNHQQENNRGGRGRGRGGGRGGRGGRNFHNDEKYEKKRLLYLNETDNDDYQFNDNNEIAIPSEEETEHNPPFSIELPMSIRGTVISGLDNFFKHHKSVNASIFYPFGSSSLSIETIHKIDDVISPRFDSYTGKKQMNLPLDQLTCMNECINSSNKSFKAGDRVILQKNLGFGVFGNYGTIICANDKKRRAVLCLDRPIRPSFAITFTNYRMKNNFSNNCVVEFPYSVLQLVDLI